MKTILFSIITLILSTSLIQPDSDKYLIKNGALGNIKVKEAKLNDIIKEFGNGKKVKETYKHSCLGKQKRQYYFYKELGIKFIFLDDNFEGAVQEIELLENCKFKTAEGIQINKSTRKDIYKIYGPIPGGQNGVGSINY